MLMRRRALLHINLLLPKLVDEVLTVSAPSPCNFREQQLLQLSFSGLAAMHAIHQLLASEVGCPDCCGTARCTSPDCTIVQHRNGHTGCLVKGKVRTVNVDTNVARSYGLYAVQQRITYSTLCGAPSQPSHATCFCAFQLFCRPEPDGDLQLCYLDDEDLNLLSCTVVLSQGGHVHGEGCGHEQVGVAEGVCHIGPHCKQGGPCRWDQQPGSVETAGISACTQPQQCPWMCSSVMLIVPTVNYSIDSMK